MRQVHKLHCTEYLLYEITTPIYCYHKNMRLEAIMNSIPNLNSILISILKGADGQIIKIYFLIGKRFNYALIKMFIINELPYNTQMHSCNNLPRTLLHLTSLLIKL